MPNAKPPTIDDSVTAFLRTLSGANKSPSTITAYRTDLAQFARFLGETNCTIAAPADVTRSGCQRVPGPPRRSPPERRHARPQARRHPGVLPLPRGRGPRRQEPDPRGADARRRSAAAARPCAPMNTPSSCPWPAPIPATTPSCRSSCRPVYRSHPLCTGNGGDPHLFRTDHLCQWSGKARAGTGPRRHRSLSRQSDHP